jgi:pilus assembly protein Flp/PilA
MQDRSFLEDDEGETAIEYALICALIFLVIVSAITLVAQKTTTMWSSISAHI